MHETFTLKLFEIKTGKNNIPIIVVNNKKRILNIEDFININLLTINKLLAYVIKYISHALDE